MMAPAIAPDGSDEDDEDPSSSVGLGIGEVVGDSTISVDGVCDEITMVGWGTAELGKW